MTCLCSTGRDCCRPRREQNDVVEAQVRPALDSLVDDADRDVRYFTRKAMQAVSAMG